MKGTFGLVGVLLATLLSMPSAAQMMSGDAGMGGGRRTIINLVSPADSLAQVRRGMLVIAQHGSASMMQTPAVRAGQDSAPKVSLLLRLSGVSDDAGLVTSGGNRLLFDGRLATKTGGEEPITIEREFALRAGGASVQVPIPLPPLSEPARILIDQIRVLDAGGDVFAAPGVVIASPKPPATPAPTPGARCTGDGDCDDGNPNTRDQCMPMGCVNLPDHMDGGPMM